MLCEELASKSFFKLDRGYQPGFNAQRRKNIVLLAEDSLSLVQSTYIIYTAH